MPEDPGWEIAPLSSSHDRGGFDCGEAVLDEFLARFARRSQDRGITRTFVATLRGERKVLGFFTLCTGAVDCGSLPGGERRRLPKHPVPVVRLGRLAVDRSAGGRGLGARLLLEALRIALDASVSVGAIAVEVAAKNGTARAFYGKYGFLPLEDDRLHLYLPLSTVRKALAK